MYEELIADVSLAKMKVALLHLYLNKQNLQMLLGNFSAAEQTFDQYKKQVGGYMIASLQSKASIGHERYRCDLLKIAHQ
jgi:hypothetical protein